MKVDREMEQKQRITTSRLSRLQSLVRPSIDCYAKNKMSYT